MRWWLQPNPPHVAEALGMKEALSWLKELNVLGYPISVVERVGDEFISMRENLIS